MTARALTITQPWADAILRGGKRVENRTWKGLVYRGEVFLHAASGLTPAADSFIQHRGIEWSPPPFDKLTRGAIVGVARIVDVIMPGGFEHLGSGFMPSQASDRRHRLAGDDWYMGGFALVLDEVDVLVKPVWCKGSLGLWRVPFEIEDAVRKGQFEGRTP